VHAGLAGGESGERRLHHRPAPGDLLEPDVLRAEPAGDLDGHLGHPVRAQRPLGLEGRPDVRQVRVEELAKAGKEGVRQTELVDAPALPHFPGVRWCRRWGRIPLEDRH
jgi:hypothetical protein